jgi:hypothetical protein
MIPKAESELLRKALGVFAHRGSHGNKTGRLIRHYFLFSVILVAGGLVGLLALGAVACEVENGEPIDDPLEEDDGLEDS